jgi:hypothetical protein
MMKATARFHERDIVQSHMANNERIGNFVEELKLILLTPFHAQPTLPQKSRAPSLPTRDTTPATPFATSHLQVVIQMDRSEYRAMIMTQVRSSAPSIISTAPTAPKENAVILIQIASAAVVARIDPPTRHSRCIEMIVSKSRCHMSQETAPSAPNIANSTDFNFAAEKTNAMNSPEIVSGLRVSPMSRKLVLTCVALHRVMLMKRIVPGPTL